MLTIYHLDKSRSSRVIWLAEELGLDYKVEVFKRAPGFLPPPEYKALHPLARAPVLRDGDLVLPETGAIFDYILQRYGNGRLVPKPGSSAYAPYLFWFHFAEGSFMPHFVSLYAMELAGGKDRAALEANPIGKTMLESLGKDVAYADSVLAQQSYLAGDQFTACDIMMCLPFRSVRQFKDRLPAHPHVEALM